MGKYIRWFAICLLGFALMGAFVMWIQAPANAPSPAPVTLTGANATELSSDGSRPLAAGVTDAERSAFWGEGWTTDDESIEEPAASVKWFEGEQPARSNFPKHHAFMPESETERAVLSEGNWLGTDSSQVGQFAEYAVAVSKAGTYNFYVRKFWRHGPFRYRFDGGQWVDVGEHVYLMDEQPLRKHVVANWIELNPVTLSAGNHILRLELTQAGKPAAFDAFVLSLEPFVARGNLKPGQRARVDHADWFPVDPPASYESTILDYPINAASAGTRGFLRAAEGKLTFSDTGDTVRFWGVNIGHEILEARPHAQEQFARHHAKWGVNLVRLHGSFAAKDLNQIDTRKLEQLFSFHAALQRHGIYLALSTYFPLWYQLTEQDGFAGYEGQHPFGLAFFDQRLIDLQQKWWRQLLTSRSPLSNRRLVDEPSLAFVELINEDSTLFWTFSPYDSVPAPQMALLERRFWSWLQEQGDDVPGLMNSGKPVRGDDIAQRRIGIMPLSELLQRRGRRAQRTAFFLASIMRQYYAQQVQFLRQLGYRGLTVCSNWHTADEMALGPLDNWANLACDVMDRHGYFSGPHTGDAAAYAVEQGQTYIDQSLLQMNDEQDAPRPGLPPFFEPRFNGKPSMASELGWPAPNRFRGEGPLLTAAYGALHDLDAVAWFAVGHTGWPRLIKKFEAGGPAGVGQFAAAARIFRQGLVAEAAPVARVNVPQQALRQLAGAPVEVTPRLDWLRQEGVPKSRPGPRSVQSLEAQSLDPMWLLKGPVDLHLGDDATSSKQRALERDRSLGETPWLDGTSSVIVSRTEQLTWDYARGSVTLAAPRAQFVIGFVSRMGRVDLPDFGLESRNEYAQVALVTLDGRPLRTSRSLLLSVGTETRNAGFRSAAGSGSQLERRIEAVGRAPILMRKIDARVFLRRPLQALEITPLDPNGMPLADPRPVADDMPLLPNVLYYHLGVRH